jgi:UDP-N-acetylglucosamine--N-acetylmuramyl-(pentapeptide) pyrophosphoryl-undecaprenol N-acetylglucosamine transferase
MTPALAVADELDRRGARVAFVTTPSQLARVGERYPAYAVEMRGFERRLLSRDNLTTLRRLAAAAPGAWRIVSTVRPDGVVGGGGYVSGPVVALAALRGVPSLALENDAHLGVTNSLLRPFVRRFCLAFPITGLGPPRFVVTGRALSERQLAADAGAARGHFGLAAERPVVLACGGSQGAQSINRACVEAFAPVPPGFQLVHVTGERNLSGVRAELDRRGVDESLYKVVGYTDRLGDLMAAADLVVGRSGGSLAEMAALGRPAVLIPYPFASGDHQRKNAEWMVAGGAAVMVPDGELDGVRLQREVTALLGDPGRLTAMAAASRALGRPRATAAIADEVERMVSEGHGRRGTSAEGAVTPERGVENV